MHLRVAEAIETTDPDAAEVGSAALAHHFYQAGSLADADKTLRYLTDAGRQALAAAAFEEAVERFTEALSFERIDEPGRAALLSDRAWALRSLAQIEDAVGDWQTALGIHERAGDAGAVAQTAWDLCGTLGWQERWSEVSSIAERAERAVPDETTPERARSLTLLAGSRALVAGSYDLADELGQKAQTIAQQLDDQRLLAEVLESRVTVDRAFDQTRKVVEMAGDAVGAARAAGNVWVLANTLSQLSFSLMSAGTPVEALRAADEAARLGTPVGYGGVVGNADIVRWWGAAMLSGDLDAMERLARSATATFRSIGAWVWVTLILESKTCFWKGDWSEANRLRDESIATFPKAASHLHTAFADGTFLLQAHQGDGTWLDRSPSRREELVRPGRALSEGDAHFLREAVEALALLDEREEAYKLYEPLRTILGKGSIAGWSLTEMSAGIASAGGHRWETAQNHFETALRQARDIPFKLAQPEVRRWYAWMLLDRDAPGDREKARGLVDEAIELYRTIGMRKHVELAEKMLNP